MTTDTDHTPSGLDGKGKIEGIWLVEAVRKPNFGYCFFSGLQIMEGLLPGTGIRDPG